MDNNSVRKVPDRAIQFAPFSALKGYYEYVKAQERIIQPRKELSEDDSEIIFNIINKLSIGMTIKIGYYDIDSYITLEGVITEVNIPYHRLKINKTSISFTDIYSINIIDKN